MARPFRAAMPEQGAVRVGEGDDLAALRADGGAQPAGGNLVGVGHGVPPRRLVARG